jgi:hypothetical protein
VWQITSDIQSNGLLVEVEVGLSLPRQEAMYRQSRAVPPPVRATFIVDSLMLALQLTPTGQARVLSSTAGGVPVPCDTYDVSLSIPHPHNSGLPPWRIPALEVLGRPLPNQSTQGMLGRDVLSLIILEYDGPRGKFTLRYR